METAALFIDGANMAATARQLGWDIDLLKLKIFLSTQYTLTHSYYFTALLEDDQGRVRLRKLIDWLKHNKFFVRTKPAKTFRNSDGTVRVKGNMDMEMAVEIFRVSRSVDRVIILSGDGDFTCLVTFLQEDRGKRVSILSTRRYGMSMVPDELVMRADQFIDISDVRKEIEGESRLSPVNQIQRSIARRAR